MKKTSLVMMLVFFSMVVFAVNAAPSPKTGMAVIQKGNVVQLYYNGLKPGKVNVKILNAMGEEVFSEILKNVENFMRPYNFSSLPYGEYTIRISDGVTTTTQVITYKALPVLSNVNVVRINVKERRFVLGIKGDEPDEYQVRIYNGDDEVVYNKKEAVVGDFSRLFNLKALQGECRFEITDSKGNVKVVKF